MTRKAITPAPASTFTDTQNEYVLKAYAAGITTGATTLPPNNSCTIEQALMAANRSLNAHRIGWYIVRSDKELRGQWFGYCTFYTTADAATKYDYVPGEMIWMTGWRDSGSVGGDFITTEPYTVLPVKAIGDNFIPVREK